MHADLVQPYNPKQAKWEGEDPTLGKKRRMMSRQHKVYNQETQGRRDTSGGLVQGFDKGLYGNGAQLKLMQVRCLFCWAVHSPESSVQFVTQRGTDLLDTSCAECPNGWIESAPIHEVQIGLFMEEARSNFRCF